MNDASATPFVAAFEALETLGILQDSFALIGIYDPSETLRYTNKAFREAYFIAEDEPLTWQELMRRNFAAGRGTVIQTDDIEAWIASVRSRRGKMRQRSYESDLHDGRYIWVVETMMPDKTIVYVGTDVTQLKPSERMVRMARDEAMRASTTDELTGVSNRRHIIGQLERIIPGCTGGSVDPHETPLLQGGAACLIDIDRFKSINDTFGHQAGDDVLIALSRSMRETLALSDAFGRVGGEEFLLLFPGQTLGAARARLAVVRQAMARLRPIACAPDRGLTFSGGLTLLKAGDTSAEVFRRCDAALYAAKAAGRDRIIEV